MHLRALNLCYDGEAGPGPVLPLYQGLFKLHRALISDVLRVFVRLARRE